MLSRFAYTVARATKISLRTASLPLCSASLLRSSPHQAWSRSIETISRPLDTPTVIVPVRKPVGAFRGGILGFLLGTAAAGAGVYYYILEEYRVSNELLTEDIYGLQAAVQRIEVYTRSLEEQVVEMQKRQ